jgi:glucose-1-phosphate cytidylyltransferase
MKVVLFCGGLGTRVAEHSGDPPKPMLRIGARPILWHLMKYYAHFGHKDFILCLGHGADGIKNYFLHYDETVSNDFVLSDGGRAIQLVSTDIHDWTITFVDTGLHSSIGERLKAVKSYCTEDEYFLANYSDGLTDLNLEDYIDEVKPLGKVMSFMSVRPPLTMHVVSGNGNGSVTALTPMSEADVWINGGFFLCRRDVFDYLEDGEDLVDGAFARLIAADELVAYRYRGFWMPLDTFRDKQRLEALTESGHAPWEVWKCV